MLRQFILSVILTALCCPSIRAATLFPGTNWNGTAGSGYTGSPPTDPVRTGPKPALRLVDYPHQVFTGQYQLAVGALCKGGIDRVIFHCEGNQVAITERSVFNNVSCLHVVTVDAASAAMTGRVAIYAEAVPKDTSLQHRVIGPYYFWLDPNSSISDAVLHVSGSLGTAAGPGTVAAPYQTINQALNRHAALASLGGEVVIDTPGNYFVGNGTSYSGCTRLMTIRPATGLTRDQVTIQSTSPASLIRPKFRKLLWQNLRFDQSTFGAVYVEDGDEQAFNGCEFYDPNGAEALYNNGYRNSGAVRTQGPFKVSFVECLFHDCMCGPRGAELASRCAVRNISGDFFLNTWGRFGNSAAAVNNDNLRSETNALTVIYTGGSLTATVQKTGSNGSSSGTLVLRENGAAILTKTLALNYKIQSLIADINALPGWSAVLQSDFLESRYLTKTGTTGFGPFAETSAKNAILQLVTGVDIHSDYVQDFGGSGAVENVCDIGCKVDATGYPGYGSNSFQGYFLSDTSGGFLDYGIALSDVMNMGSSNSQLSATIDHLIIDGLRMDDHQLLFRTDITGEDKFIPTNSEIVNSTFWKLSGGTFPNGVSMSNNHFETGTVYGTNTTTGDPTVNCYGVPHIGSLLLNRYSQPYELPFDRLGRALPREGAAIGPYQFDFPFAPTGLLGH